LSSANIDKTTLEIRAGTETANVPGATMRAALLLSILASSAASAEALFMQTVYADSIAPGQPGTAGTWAPAAKSLLGTSFGTRSRVYFTGYRGSVSEVFYPTLDAVQTVDLEFFVADRAKTFVDEERQQPYRATQPDPHSMRWQSITSNAEHRWRITKEVFTDPTQNSLIVHATFEALAGRRLGDFNLFLFHDPSLGNSNAGDTSRTQRHQRRVFLVASEGQRASALGISRTWARACGKAMVSSGFVGASDGRADLATDRTMDWAYDLASGGNVAQMGWIDLGDKGNSAVTFTSVLSFGTTEGEAIAAATATLTSDIQGMRRRYDDEWHDYVSGLDGQGGTADNQYYLAAMTLRVAQDKSNGAMVAGMGTPWGESSGDANPSGYHMVWSRDVFKFANALVTAGDLTAGVRIVRYLFGVLQQKVDCGDVEGKAPECPHGYTRKGRFPQNAWVDGGQYWTATQMDEQAMPILLAWRVWDKGDATTKKEIQALWPIMRSTADLILANGPWTQEERWEESSGYSPSTIAAEVAGLVAASEFARMSGDIPNAARYLAAADYWQQNVTNWTFTTTGPLGNKSYFVRLNPAQRQSSGVGFHAYDPTTGPDEPTDLLIGNGGGAHDQRAILDGGFLELVRMGVKRAADAAIVGSLPEYDSVVKQTVLGKGNAWFRYNYDGYGERNDGGSYDARHGRGRLWPIFTAERGMYEIARVGNGDAGTPYLAALKAFSTPEGFLPEQVWTETTTTNDWTVVTPAPYSPGTPTKSVAPLNWAMGEYISLLASIHTGTPADVPRITCMRYNTCAVPPSRREVTVDVNVAAVTTAGQHVYVTGDADVLGNWNADLGIPADATDYPLWRTRLYLPAGRPIQYKYYRKDSDGSVAWEKTSDGANRKATAPSSGGATWHDTVRW